MNKKLVSLVLLLGFSTLFLGACGGGDNSTTPTTTPASPAASPTK